MELPVMDEKYKVGEVIPKNLFPGLDVEFGDGSVSGDTVSVLRKGTLSASIEKQLLRIDTAEIERSIGPFVIKNIPPLNVHFSLKSILPDENVYHVPLPVPLQLRSETEKNMDGVVSLTVDSGSSPLKIFFVNNTLEANFENIMIILLDAYDTIAHIYIDEIPAQTTETVSVSLAGKSLHFPMKIQTAVTLPAGAYLRTSDTFGISFSLNRQMISEAVMKDSLFDYSNVFSGKLKIADSIRIHSVDLQSIALEAEIYCPDFMKVEIGGTIQDSWDKDFSKKYNLQSVDQLRGIADSSGVAGAFSTDTLFQTTGSACKKVRIHIPSIRLFPSWDPEKNATFLIYHFWIHSLPEGRLLRVSKNDLFKIKVYSTPFPFERANVCMIKETEFSFSHNVKVGFNWKTEVTDSLKKNMHFENVRLLLDLNSDLPSGSVLDSVLVNINMHENKKVSDCATFEKKFINVRTGTQHSAWMDVTTVFNTWPDTVTFDVKMALPKRTSLTLFNRDNWQTNFTAPCAMKMDLNWSLLVPLCWNVIDTVRVELDKTVIAIPSDNLDWIRKVQDPRVRIQMKVENHTNISFTLHGLGACGRHKEKLLSIPNTGNGIRDNTDADVFSLFDDEGLKIAANGEESNVELMLDKKGIDALLSQDSCLIRWFLMIPSQKTDALLATDFFTLQAKGMIEGVGDTDSLLMNQTNSESCIQQAGEMN